ncbi:hypothetical protein, partial [Daejeonella sp.]|uniref:hypothetical protein n=1 Tax=Daejeonella sp. TaxID=2805397 RepID=UPI0030BE748A
TYEVSLRLPRDFVSLKFTKRLPKFLSALLINFASQPSLTSWFEFSVALLNHLIKPRTLSGYQVFNAPESEQGLMSEF